MNNEFIVKVVTNVLDNNFFTLYDEVKYLVEYQIKAELEMHYNGVTVESNSNDGINVEFTIKNGEEVVTVSYYGESVDFEG